METGYSQEQEAFRHSVRRFLEDQGGPAFTRQHWHKVPGSDSATWQQMARLGVCGLLAREDSGGAGGSMADMGVVMEELGRHVHPGPYWSCCVGGVCAAQLFGQKSLLGELLSGRETATLAIAEPGRSFTAWPDPAVRAVHDRVSGEKVEVADAGSANYFFVTTAQGVYLVAAGAEGLSVDSSETFDGSRNVSSVRFDNTPGVRLGDNAQLAPAIDHMLVALCADGLGAAQRVLELTVAHASERYQFGQPIGSFQAIQHLCADMLQTIELGRSALHYALWAQDGADEREAHRAAVMTKAYMAEKLPQIGADAIQIFGGAGFTWEYDVQLYYKRLLSTQMTWGNETVWLEELARCVIDDPAPAIVPD